MTVPRWSRLVLGGVLGLGLALAHAAFAAEEPPPAPAPKPPPWGNPAYVENWDAYRCVPVRARGDLTDRLKAIPPGSWFWVNVGGQIRFRYEAWQNQAFGAIADADDDWLLTRLRLHVDAHFGEHFRLFAEGIYADQEEREAGPRPVDEDQGDFLNLFAEGYGGVGCDTRLGAWVGRRELLFGKQRVIGPLDWANTRRTFEGAGAWLEGKAWRLDGLWVRPVKVLAEEWDESNDDVQLAGLYYANKASARCQWDAYALWYENQAATWLGATGEEERFMVGLRANGAFPSSPFDYDSEAGFQVGSFEDEAIVAGFVSLEVGWKPACLPCLAPRLALGLDWASGDADGEATDGLQTYNQLFPTGHAFFGWIDYIGREDLLAARLTLTAKPGKDWFLRADVHGFWRASEDDEVYAASGGVLRADGGSDALYVGSELDLLVRWTPGRHWEFELGYGHFFAGTFIDDTGAHEDVDFGYGSVTFNF